MTQAISVSIEIAWCVLDLIDSYAIVKPTCVGIGEKCKRHKIIAWAMAEAARNDLGLS